MYTYYINMNAQSNGDHEIHKSSCIYYILYKSGNNFENLGIFLSDAEAVVYAKNKYPYWTVDGCSKCCPSKHTR